VTRGQVRRDIQQEFEPPAHLARQVVGFLRRMVVAPWVDLCGPPLRTILKQLAGQQARLPVNRAIKLEYLAYHRAEVLRGEAPAPKSVVLASPD
jgi:hypothetical protein